MSKLSTFKKDRHITFAMQISKDYYAFRSWLAEVEHKCVKAGVDTSKWVLDWHWHWKRSGNGEWQRKNDGLKDSSYLHIVPKINPFISLLGVKVETTDGMKDGDIGDWVVCDKKGQWDIVRNDDFQADYKAA